MKNTNLPFYSNQQLTTLKGFISMASNNLWLLKEYMTFYCEI